MKLNKTSIALGSIIFLIAAAQIGCAFLAHRPTPTPRSIVFVPSSGGLFIPAAKA